MSNASAMAHMRYMGSSERPRGGTLQRLHLERWDVRCDGPLSEAALMRKLDAFGYDAAPRIYEAGPAGAPRADGRERVLAVLAGLIKVAIDGDSAILTAGDALFVSRGAFCRVEVVGASPAYCLEAVYRADPA